MQKLASSEDVTKFLKNVEGQGLFGISHADWIQKFFVAGVTEGNMLPSVVASYATKGMLGDMGLAASTIEKGSKTAALSLMFT